MNSSKPLNDKDLQGLVTDKVLECFSKAENWIAERNFDCHTPTFHLPDEIKFTLRGRTAGRATTSRDYEGFVSYIILNFNMVLLRENIETFLGRTVPHECAHSIAGLIFGNVKSHGDIWKLVMKNILGVKPSRTHDYDVTNARVYNKTKFEWKCSCRSHIVGPVKHKKMMRNTTYFCKSCKSGLTFVKRLGRVTYEDARNKIS